MVRALSTLGNLAQKNHMYSEALQLHTAASLARPQSEIPYIGIGVAHTNSGNFEEAIVALRDNCLRINPNEPTAKAFLGLVFVLKGQKPEGEALLREVVSKGSAEPSVLDFARSTLKDMLDIEV